MRLLVWRIPGGYSRDSDKIVEFLVSGNVGKKTKAENVLFFVVVFVIVVSLIKTAKRRLGGRSPSCPQISLHDAVKAALSPNLVIYCIIFFI